MNPAQTDQARHVTLNYTDGSSDKTYQVALEATGDGWVVNFAYGRRGGALKTGTKTNSPVTWAKANDIFDKQLKAKMSKGYTEAESGARYAGTDLAEKDSGLAAMLPSPMKPGDLLILIGDDRYIFQEKMDGENRQIVIDGEGTRGVNRRGLFCALREEWDGSALHSDEGRTILAGEDMGTYFAAFDLVELRGQPIGQENAIERHLQLCKLCAGIPWIRVVPLATGRGEKQALLKRIEEEGGEGIVAKQVNAPYQGGRTEAHLKHKFQESATFEVVNVNAQRSVALGLYNAAGEIENLGNVTIPANHEVPSLGDLVEVEYMMRYEGGALMQPKYKGRRTDIDEKPGVDQITRIKLKEAVI